MKSPGDTKRRHPGAAGLARGCRLGFTTIVVGLALGLTVPPAMAQTVQEQKQFADGLYSRGMNAMAIREYQKALDTDAHIEGADEIMFRMAEAHRALGDQVAAERLYRQVMTDHAEGPYRHKAEFRRAELYIAGNRFGDAIVLLEDLLADNPADDLRVSVFYFLGYCHEREGEKGKAVKSFQEVLAAGDEHAYTAYTCLALAQLYMQDPSKGGVVGELLHRAIRTASSERLAAEARFLLGDAAYRRGDFEASMKAYAELLEKHPEDRRSGEAQLQAAWSYLKAGQPAGALALADVQRVDAPASERGEWQYLKANALRQADRQEDARAAYAEFGTLFPSHERAGLAAYEHGLLLFREGRYDEALDMLQAVEATDQIAEDLEWLKAEAAISADRMDAALEAYRAIQRMFPDADRTPVAAYRCGRLLQDTAQFEPALDAYRDLVTKHPKHALAPEAMMGIAYSETRLERYRDALTAWRRLVQDYPGTAQHEQALYQLALAEMHQEQNVEAVTSLRRFLETYPGAGRVAEAAYWLAVLQDQAGDVPSAAKRFRQALEAAKDDDLVGKATMGLATVLKKQAKDAEAADLWQGMLGTPAGGLLDASLLEWLARFQAGRAQHQEALVAAQALADREGVGAWHEIGWYLVGRARLALGHVDEATQAFATACEGSSPGTREAVEAAFQFAELSAQAGRWDVATTYYEKSAEHASKPDMIDLRARSYYGLGRAAVGREAWDDAARLFMSVGILFDDPDLTPDALHQAAAAFGKLGQDHQKSKVEAELKERYPDSSWAKRSE